MFGAAFSGSPTCGPSDTTAGFPHCSVYGCTEPLQRGYDKKCRICPEHRQAHLVLISGVSHRFCQKCSKFHPLEDFDGNKKNCRQRLEEHNSRQRRIRMLRRKEKTHTQDLLGNSSGSLPMEYFPMCFSAEVMQGMLRSLPQSGQGEFANNWAALAEFNCVNLVQAEPSEPQISISIQQPTETSYQPPLQLPTIFPSNDNTVPLFLSKPSQSPFNSDPIDLDEFMRIEQGAVPVQALGAGLPFGARAGTRAPRSVSIPSLSSLANLSTSLEDFLRIEDFLAAATQGRDLSVGFDTLPPIISLPKV